MFGILSPNVPLLCAVLAMGIAPTATGKSPAPFVKNPTWNGCVQSKKENILYLIGARIMR